MCSYRNYSLEDAEIDNLTPNNENIEQVETDNTLLNNENIEEVETNNTIPNDVNNENNTNIHISTLTITDLINRLNDRLNSTRTNNRFWIFYKFIKYK